MVCGRTTDKPILGRKQMARTLGMRHLGRIEAGKWVEMCMWICKPGSLHSADPEVEGRNTTASGRARKNSSRSRLFEKRKVERRAGSLMNFAFSDSRKKRKVSELHFDNLAEGAQILSGGWCVASQKINAFMFGSDCETQFEFSPSN